MLTRGHLIGQVVDDLAGIAAQAKQRGRLHLFDIHTHVEEFAKEVLNRTLGLCLSNLNEEHSNNPGLDLGDASSGWAFQVTADKSLTKIRKTLENIDSEQRKKYSNIRVLVIGEKQGSYTFSGEPFQSFDFKPEMVWDFNDVCSRTMALPIDDLKDLANYVSQETQRVRIELEIPDEDGQFPTSIDSLIEALPKPRLSNATKMEKYFVDQEDTCVCSRSEAAKAIEELSKKLRELPRLTREVFKFLVERRDVRTTGMDDNFRISDPKLRRIYHGDDLDGDLTLLVEAGLLSFSEPDDHGEAYYWCIQFPGSSEGFHITFCEYIDALRIDLRKPLVILDFSDF